MLKTKDIRLSFVDFFRSKGHQVIPSANLIPHNDPTLLFTSAGMVPFKSYFSSIEAPSSPRMVSIQKCMRTTDIKEVGKTKCHLSFFEMLGNFSFGDYFKKKAIQFAWEYSTEHLHFAKEDIWISVYKDDDEAFSIWKNYIGVPSKRIVRLGEKDNFWGPVSQTGVCGPCSELYLDRGKAFDPSEICNQPGDKGERFLEFWNLVFNQYDKDIQNNFHLLQTIGIDTGAGLERLAVLTQKVDSVFETDELQMLIKAVCLLYKVELTAENKKLIFKIADHIRSLCFCIADGIYPSNESQGYVVRKLLRSAMLQGKELGQTQALLYKLVSSISIIYNSWYPELKIQEEITKKIIEDEENKFHQTIDFGLAKFSEILDKSHKVNMISGKDAFLLYDTFGFPIEMTKELAAKRNVKVDIDRFLLKLEEQKNKGRQAWIEKKVILPLSGLEDTSFVGYRYNKYDSVVQRIFLDKEEKKSLSDNQVQTENFIVVTEKTPFYPESGGQLGDSGIINSKNFSLKVYDTQKNNNIILHYCKGLEGTINTNDTCRLSIEGKRREYLKQNHSATHLLHAALRQVLGDHIKQSGSLVHDKYIRFDFTHPTHLSSDEILRVENIVNQSILNKEVVITQILPKQKAEKLGALMTFSEKYQDTVRVVTIGKNTSSEFCGGTHVDNTKQIQCFIINQEKSSSATVRRIEALTNEGVHKKVNALQKENEASIKELQLQIQVNQQLTNQKYKNLNIIDILKNIDKLHNEYRTLLDDKIELPSLFRKILTLQNDCNELQKNIKKITKEYKKNESNLSNNDYAEILKNKKEINQKNVILTSLPNQNIATLKISADKLRDMNNEILYILYSHDLKQVAINIVVATSRQYANSKSFNAHSFIQSALKELASAKKVGGGGKAEIAQGTCYFNTEDDIKVSEEELRVICYSLI